MKMKDIKIFMKVVDNTILSDKQISDIQNKILNSRSLDFLLVEAVNEYKKNLRENLEEKIDESNVKI